MLTRIGKCKTCKEVSRKDYHQTRPVMVGKGMFRRAANEYFTTYDWGCPAASKDVWCPRCGVATWASHRIDGYTTDTRCDARCTGAKGFQCECSCGGKNHGKQYLVCELVAA